MFKQVSSDDPILDQRLHDEAMRQRPAFDESLHAQIMGQVQQASPSSAHHLASPWRIGPRNTPLNNPARYALAATIVLALGLIAIVGSGWLRDRINQRHAKRQAIAFLTTVPDAATTTSPVRALGSAGSLVDQQWADLNQGVRAQVDHVTDHWAFRMFFAPTGEETSEKMTDPAPPSGV